VVDNAALDFTDRTPEKYGFCVFGEVVDGLDVVNQIAAVEVKVLENSPDSQVQPAVIKSAKIK
jgi:cyclophilin family peptidyl-prolyl cis-trans isomerase